MAEAPPAAVVVRNTASHDARVLRCAAALRSLGYEPVVLGVTSEEETDERSQVGGVPIVRLSPRAPLAGRVRRLRGGGRERPGGGRRGAPAAAGAPGERERPGLATRAYRLLRTLSYYRRGIAAMRRLRPRLVHCNDYNTMWIGVGAKLLAGSALIYDSHELWPDRNGRSEPRWWLLACETLFLRIADRNLATSPGHAGAIARRHRVPPPAVVRNIAERPTSNGDGARPPATEGAARTIVYAGALTAGRGLEQAIAALPGAGGIRLRLVGPGNRRYRELLAALAGRHGVADRVAVEPPVDPRRVVEEISAAAAGLALIQPTCLSYELCLPNKLFEYLGAGLPVLAADLPTIRSFVGPNGVGLLVGPEDTAAIARAMREIVEPRRNRALREAVRRTAAEHCWERERERLRELYVAAAAARGGR